MHDIGFLIYHYKEKGQIILNFIILVSTVGLNSGSRQIFDDLKRICNFGNLNYALNHNPKDY